MTLWACLLFPTLPLDVFARAQSPDDAHRPFVVGSGGHYPRVVAANAAARDAGIRDDQLIAGALALAPDLVLRDRDADAESRALAQLATWTLTFTHLSGAATAAHIHLGPRGTAGAVLVPLCAPCSSPATSTATLTQSQIDNVKAGKTYVNVHTTKNPNGEIRGQITNAK